MDDYLSGIDVSHWQGDIDSATVAKSGVQFAFMKATEAGSYQDPKFEINWKGAKEHGIIRGAYHFFQSDVDYCAQSANFIGILRSLIFNPTSDYAIVDVEDRGLHGDDKEKTTDNLYQFLKAIEYAFGVKPLIYTNNSSWNNKIAYQAYDFTQYQLWLARWASEPTPIPGNWKDWICWQYSATGRVEGIKGDVDLDKMKSSSIEVIIVE